MILWTEWTSSDLHGEVWDGIPKRGWNTGMELISETELGSRKRKGISGKILLLGKNRGYNTFQSAFVSSYWHWEPKTDCKKYRNTVRIRLWWFSFGKCSLTGEFKKLRTFLNKISELYTPLVRYPGKKITQYAFHSPLAIFVLITSEMCFTQKSHLGRRGTWGN